MVTFTECGFCVPNLSSLAHVQLQNFSVMNNLLLLASLVEDKLNDYDDFNFKRYVLATLEEKILVIGIFLLYF